jgi:hypothetical protein
MEYIFGVSWQEVSLHDWRYWIDNLGLDVDVQKFGGGRVFMEMHSPFKKMNEVNFILESRKSKG